MTGLRRYWWSLLVVAFLIAGALIALRPGGISGAPAPVQAATATSASATLPSKTAAVGRVADPVAASSEALPAQQAPELATESRAEARPRTSPRPTTASPTPVAVTPVIYAVTLSQDALLPGSTYTVRGFSYSSPGAHEVALLLHGFSYDYREWDFPAPSPDPQNPSAYSTARYLSTHGIDAVAIDLLGVGSSDHPSGLDALQLTIPAYASMAHQIVQSLRSHYEKVVTVGASSGGEIANVEAGRYRDVDGTVDLAFCDLPLFSAQIVVDNLSPTLAGLVQPYVDWEGTTAARDRMLYNFENTDPAVITQSDALVQPISSAELHTTEAQPGRALDLLVNVPVLVAFGQQDSAWLPACQTAQAGLYLSSPSVTTFILPGAGHALMLHRNAGVFEAELLGWLKGH
jgi:pimeloyl-ACP methyl ester carboxylesterase